jgi:hypothetical protein
MRLFPNNSHTRSALAAFALFTAAASTSAQPAAAPQDLTEPRAAPTATSAGQVRTFTHASNSLSELTLWYENGLGLTRTGPLKHAPSAVAAQRRLWQVPAGLDWQEYRFSRPNMPELADIRALIFTQTLAPLHQSWNSLELGPMAIGIPNTTPELLDSKLRRLGFGAQGPLNQYEVPYADTSKGNYSIKETIFNGPDYSKAVSVYRGNGIPLSPIAPDTQLGGPAYLSIVVPDSTAMLEFFTRVLDYEVRSDRVWTTSGALGAPIGTQYRFLILYAKGARFGHVLLLEYTSIAPITPALAPRLPQRGLVALSMPTPNLNSALAASRALKLSVRGPEKLNDRDGKPMRVATVVAPNGMMFELSER